MIKKTVLYCIILNALFWGSFSMAEVNLSSEVRYLRQSLGQLKIDMQRANLQNLEALKQINNRVNQQLSNPVNNSTSQTNGVYQRNQNNNELKNLILTQQEQINQLKIQLSILIKSQQERQPVKAEVISSSTLTLENTFSTNQGIKNTPDQTVTNTNNTSISSEDSVNEPTTEDNGKEVFLKSFNLLATSQFVEATQSFQQFLSENPQSSLTSEALYWLGESYYVQNDFKNSLASYNKVINNHPTSEKFGESLLKSSFSLIELERYGEAKLILNRVKNEFPNSNILNLANQKLELVKLLEE